MNAIQQLLTDHIGIWTTADTGKKSGRGRSSSNAGNVYGIRKLRELILDLAVRGKLVLQNTNDESASTLLKRIRAEKITLLNEGKIKKGKPLAAIMDKDKPFELPRMWEWVRLGDITNFGSTAKLNCIDSDTWVLDLEDIEKDTSNLLQKVKFSERGSLSDKNSFYKGDVLYGKLRPYLNKVIVADEDGVCTTEILPIRCYGPFNSDYFKIALKSPYFIKYVNRKSYGMKMPRLGTEDGRQAFFPLAPLAEQHRIVAKVDELMALCNQIETQHNNTTEAHEKLVSHLLGTLIQSQSAEEFSENWQRIAAHFDILFTTETSIDALKQTLLQLAVMGKLVSQDSNDEPASELLQRIQDDKAKLIAEGKIKKDKLLHSVTENQMPFELPQEWAWVTLNDFMPEFQNGASSRGDSDGESVVVLRLADIKDRCISLEDPRKLLIAPRMIDKYRLSIGDILIVRVNGSADLVGGFVVCEQSFDGIYCDHFIRMRISESILNPRFLALVGASPLVRDRIEDLFITTAGQKTVNQGHIGSLQIPLLSVAEQYRIVAKVDELMALCDQLKLCIFEARELQQKVADVMVEQAVA